MALKDLVQFIEEREGGRGGHLRNLRLVSFLFLLILNVVVEQESIDVLYRILDRLRLREGRL